MKIWCTIILALTAACVSPPEPPVFLWHAVGEGSGDKYDVPADEFDAELALLNQYGAEAVTLDELFDAREGKRTLPKRAVVITFDDGRACLYKEALPLLQKHHMRAEVFVVTSLLGDSPEHRQSYADDTGPHPYLIWPELKAMVASGTFMAESHAKTHVRLPSLSTSAQMDELKESAQALRQALSAPVHFFAYPFGSFTPWTQLLAWRAGYRGAASVEKRTGYRFAIPRHSLRRGTLTLFAKELEELFGPVPSLVQR